MNYQKLSDFDKLRIIERKVYDDYSTVKIIADALQFRTVYDDYDNHSDCIKFLRKAQSNLHQLRNLF